MSEEALGQHAALGSTSHTRTYLWMASSLLASTVYASVLSSCPVASLLRVRALPEAGLWNCPLLRLESPRGKFMDDMFRCEGPPPPLSARKDCHPGGRLSSSPILPLEAVTRLLAPIHSASEEFLLPPARMRKRETASLLKIPWKNGKNPAPSRSPFPRHHSRTSPRHPALTRPSDSRKQPPPSCLSCSSEEDARRESTGCCCLHRFFAHHPPPGTSREEPGTKTGWFEWWSPAAGEERRRLHHGRRRASSRRDGMEEDGGGALLQLLLPCCFP